MKRAVDAIRPNIGNRHDVDVIWIQRPDQHVAFIARADDAHAEPVVELRPIIEILGPKPDRGRGAADDADRGQKLAARAAGGLVEVLFANCSFLRESNYSSNFSLTRRSFSHRGHREHREDMF